MNPTLRGDLEAALAAVRAAPRDAGRVELVVRRTGSGRREILAEASLDPELGLVGDAWHATGGRAPDRARQLTLMGARAIALLASDREQWAAAGDQLYVDFDLSQAHLPPGAQVRVGQAVIAISEAPHLGCRKFAERFGPAALGFVNSQAGRALRLRGVNAQILVAGVVRPGDDIQKL